MSVKTEAWTRTVVSSSDTIDWRLRQEPEMDPQGIEISTDELTLRSVDEQIKQATDPILRRVEEYCALLAGRTELESAGNRETSGSRHENAPSSPSRPHHDTYQGYKKKNVLCHALLINIFTHGSLNFVNKILQFLQYAYQCCTLVGVYFYNEFLCFNFFFPCYKIFMIHHLIHHIGSFSWFIFLENFLNDT